MLCGIKGVCLYLARQATLHWEHEVLPPGMVRREKIKIQVLQQCFMHVCHSSSGVVFVPGKLKS